MLVLFRKTGKLACSFCGGRACDVTALVAGGTGRICEACAASCVKAMAPNDAVPDQPCVRAIPRKAEPAEPPANDTESLLGRLNVAQTTMETNRDAVENHVRELRRRKTSWAKIGDSLGISRQAAWQRFS